MPDELKSYQPNLREQIAQALMGDARPGSFRSKLVSGVMGTEGLPGTEQVGAVDFTPAMPVLAKDEMDRAQTPSGLFTAALGALPGASPEKQAGRKLIAYFDTKAKQYAPNFAATVEDAMAQIKGAVGTKEVSPGTFVPVNKDGKRIGKYEFHYVSMDDTNPNKEVKLTKLNENPQSVAKNKMSVDELFDDLIREDISLGHVANMSPDQLSSKYGISKQKAKGLRNRIQEDLGVIDLSESGSNADELFDSLMSKPHILEDRREYRPEDLARMYGLDDVEAKKLFDKIQNEFRPTVQSKTVPTQ